MATDTGEKSPPETNEWIRSYGRPPGNPKHVPGNLWCNPVWKAYEDYFVETSAAWKRDFPNVRHTSAFQIWPNSCSMADGEIDKVASGSVAGNVLTQNLRAPSTATKMSSLKETSWSQDQQIIGANGIAALSFCDVVLQQRGTRQR